MNSATLLGSLVTRTLVIDWLKSVSRETHQHTYSQSKHVDVGDRNKSLLHEHYAHILVLCNKSSSDTRDMRAAETKEGNRRQNP